MNIFQWQFGQTAGNCIEKHLKNFYLILKELNINNFMKRIIHLHLIIKGESA